MPKTVYYNGKYYKKGRAVLPISDRSIFFGDAVYDAMVGHGGGIFLLDDHLERLLSNARRLGIVCNYTIAQLRAILFNVAKKSKLEEYFLYIQLSRCSDERSHAYPASHKASLLVTAKGISMPRPEKRLKLITVEDRRYGFCDVKTVNLLPNVIAAHTAESVGCDEAIFVRDGVVTECAHSNLSIIRDGAIQTHPDSRFILPGIAKKRLLAVAAEIGISAVERPFSAGELFDADEVIITSTTKICLAACEINGKPVGGRDQCLLKKLQERLFSEYTSWTM